MSEVPPPYNRSYSFTDFSTYTPNLQQPGNKIDQELNNVRVSVNATIDRLSEIQRDDGKLDSTSLDFNDIFTGLSTQLSLTYAALNSPALTGSPTAPTPSTSDSSTKIATTAFVKNQNYATISDLASLQSSLSGYLTLGGGTISGNLIVDAGEGSSGHFEPTEIYVTRNDATGTAANAYGALYNGGLEVGDSAGNYAELTTTHLRFGDGSTQASAYNPAVLSNYLPLAGGVLNYGTNHLGINPQNGQGGQICFDYETGVTSLDGYQLSFQDGTSSYRADGASISGSIELPNETVYIIIEGGNGIGVNRILEQTGVYISPDWVRFPDNTLQITAALPITGGTMSGAIRFDNVGTQNISKGSFDSGRGGYNGISLVCAVDYELNWQAGYLKALNSGGFNVPINVESDIVSYSHEGNPQHTTLTANSLNIHDDEVNTNATLTNQSSGSSLTLQGIPGGNSDLIHQSQLSHTGLTFTANIDGVEEEVTPYARTTIISNAGGISYNGNNDNNDHSFSLNTGGVGGSPSSDYSWGLSPGGVGGDDPDNSFAFSPTSVGGQTNNNQYSFGLSATGVGGFNDYHTWGINTSGAGGSQDGDSPWNVGSNGFSANNEADTCALNGSQVTGYNDATGQTWSFGINGLTFADGTTLTTASGGVISAGTITEGDNHLTTDALHLAFYSDVDANSSLNQSELRLNSNIDYYTSLTNQELHIASDDQHIHVKATTGITFGNGVAINSPSTQNAAIPYTLYDKEVVITIDGVTYAMLARIV